MIRCVNLSFSFIHETNISVILHRPDSAGAPLNESLPPPLHFTTRPQNDRKQRLLCRSIDKYSSIGSLSSLRKSLRPFPAKMKLICPSEAAPGAIVSLAAASRTDLQASARKGATGGLCHFSLSISGARTPPVRWFRARPSSVPGAFPSKAPLASRPYCQRSPALSRN